MNQETEVQNRIRLHLSERFPGILLWRNTLGFDSRAKVYYGIGNPGGSDLIGLYRGRFIAIEVKVPGARTEPERLVEQTNFIRVTKGSGALAGFANSPEEAEAIINGK